MIAVKAQENEDTKEFANNYLKPLNILSMLDIPLFINGEAKGVVCFEQQDIEKDWTDEDISFVKSITDLIAISFQSSERTSNILLLQKQKEEIIAQNRSFEALTKALQESNEHLDARVKERTLQLEIQNNYFAEYTFINVHLLRAPLCRVMGLTELLKFSNLTEDDKYLIEKLDYESKDLERLITKITKVLESGETIDRTNI